MKKRENDKPDDLFDERLLFDEFLPDFNAQEMKKQIEDGIFDEYYEDDDDENTLYF